MPQSFSSVTVHIVFSTKNRIPSISNEIEGRLYAYIGGIVRNRKAPLLVVGGTADHLHMLVSLPRDVCLADLVREIKSLSSGWIHQTCGLMRDFSWQAGYGAFSVSFTNINSVRNYIDKQKEHHRGISYKEEFIQFLQRHNLPYNEKYLWE
ncbi:MAG: IS200/IS605 family transposase [Candidatus Aureabacteria bacterium]|nr:IS200/IS605 family transposase [Candidatus Auribacterota bacterium]